MHEFFGGQHGRCARRIPGDRLWAVHSGAAGWNWVIGHGLSITREHDEIGLVTGFGPSPRLSRTPVAPGRPAPTPGAQGREILEEIGMGQQFDRLVEQGVILTDGVAAG